MTQSLEERLRALFDAARQLSSEERAEFVTQRCQGEPELKKRVDALLAHDQLEDCFLDTPLLADDDKELLAGIKDGWEQHLPDRLGRYRVVREIGSGSMGTVFEAELESPRRTVAVKVLRPGVSTAPMLRRFQFEADVLKRLDHPFVARFYDSGTTDTGHGPQPFFAMEFVEGRPLTDFADERALSTRQRLELLAKVCDAVHHAHTKGVIHRDLKPTNVLVDATGRPRVLDFGVARAIHGDTDTQTNKTATGQVVGTLQYMSPEQAIGDPAEVDTRCDIYSLGVIGFELLGGKTPYDLGRRTIPEAVRILTESDPPRLGTIHRILRGDVETIIAKALEKERDRRYQSASDLAADIRRCLSDEPIIARPPSALYQLSKYAKRNKGWFAGTVAVLVVLVFGLAGTGYGLLTANEQRREAESSKREAEEQRSLAEGRLADAEVARDESEAVTGLLARMLESASPRELGRDVMVRDVLDEASATLGEELAERPLVEARMRHTLGSSYLGLGEYDVAREHLERALDIRRRILGPGHADAVRSAVRLVILLIEQGKYGEAETLQRSTLELQRSALGEQHPETLASLSLLAVTYYTLGRFEEAEKLYTEVLQIQQTELGKEHPDTLDTLHNLALAQSSAGRYDHADELLREIHETERRVFGEDHPDTLATLNSLAALQQEMGRFERAETLFVDVVERRTRVLGKEHPVTLLSMGALAYLYTEWSRLDEAEPLSIEVLASQQALLGNEHPSTLDSMNRLALLRQAQGRFEEAEAVHLEVLEIQGRTRGEAHPSSLATMNSLASLYMEQGRYDEAGALHAEALEIQKRELGEEHPDTLVSTHNLACLRILQGRLEDAAPLCERTLAIRRRVLGVEHPDTQSSMNTLTVLYEKQKRYEDAESMYLQTLEIQRRLLGDAHEQVLVSMNNLGDLYNTLERFEEAEQVLSDLVGRTRRALPPKHWFLGAFLTKYGVALRGLGRYDQAEKALLEAHEIVTGAFGPDHHRTVTAARALADLYDVTSKPNDAAKWRSMSTAGAP